MPSITQPAPAVKVDAEDAGPHVEPDAEDRDWWERMAAREEALEEMAEREAWLDAWEAYLDSTVGRYEPHHCGTVLAFPDELPMAGED